MKIDKKKDIAYASVKAVLGSIPIAGAAASELFGLLVTPPLEKRREKWMQEIGEGLTTLEKDKLIDLSKLQLNDSFIDIVIKITQLAIKTNEKDKLLLFQSIIENAALNQTLDITETHIFLNLIDSFTIWHIKLLLFFNDPEGWFNQNNKPIPNYMAGSLFGVLSDAYPELKEKPDLCNLIWDDLKRASLHNTGSLNGVLRQNGLLVSRTTDLGKRFIEFIKLKE